MKLKYLATALCLMPTLMYAGVPVWTFTPLTSTTVPDNATSVVQYRVTNQSIRPHTLAMNPIPGVTQITSGPGLCANPFVLPTKGSSCVLSLSVNGSETTAKSLGGPVVCQIGSLNLCYRPSEADILRVTTGTSGYFIGQAAQGGTVACLGGQPFSDLIVATPDGVRPWSSGIFVGTPVTNDQDGETNTANIIAVFGIANYPAFVCTEYQIDSNGNSPCITGTCYSDWYLAAKDQLNCLYTNKNAIGGFANAYYWSSSTGTAGLAWAQDFTNGNQNMFPDDSQATPLNFRCVRSFTP